MSFDISVAGNYGDGEAGELTVAANASKSDLNGYARVTGIDGKILTVESFSDSTKFKAGTWLFVHVAGYTGSGTFKYLGRWKISYIKAIEGNRLTMNKSFSGLAGGNANALIQAVTVPEFTKVTLKGTLTCPQFNTTNNYGGVVAFMCSEELIFDGGNINLNGKGLSSASLRPEFNFESYLEEKSYNAVEMLNLNAKYTGFENYKLRTHMPLNYPDGAAFILAKKITCDEDSRIGNPSKAGEQRRPVQKASEKGGANILIAAEEIENFDVKMISKLPSVTSGGKGRSGCYIATEAILPCDEGTYAYDRITTPSRLNEIFKIKDFGNGRDGTPSAANAVKQLNSYSLPTASVSTKGGVKVGSGLSMSGDTLNVTLSSGAVLDTVASTVDGGMWYETTATAPIVKLYQGGSTYYLYTNQLVSPNLSLSDSTVTVNNSASQTITLSYSGNGTITLSNPNTTALTASYDSTTKTITLTSNLATGAEPVSVNLGVALSEAGQYAADSQTLAVTCQGGLLNPQLTLSPTSLSSSGTVSVSYLGEGTISVESSNTGDSGGTASYNSNTKTISISFDRMPVPSHSFNIYVSLSAAGAYASATATVFCSAYNEVD